MRRVIIVGLLALAVPTTGLAQVQGAATAQTAAANEADESDRSITRWALPILPLVIAIVLAFTVFDDTEEEIPVSP